MMRSSSSFFNAAAPDPAHRRKVLVDDPARLFGF